MITVDIDQRSKMWLTWRESGIGASESAAVLGLSKYKTPLQLWEEKTGRGFPTEINEDMQRGIDLEDDARNEIIRLFKYPFFPMCGEHEKHPYIKASFDALSEGRSRIVEIKCPRGNKLRKAIETQDVDVIKDLYMEYWVQIQHQYAVCETVDIGNLAAYQDGTIHLIEIPRDNDFIDKELIPGIKKFWKYVTDDVEPPLSDADYVYIDDAEAIEIAEEYITLGEVIKLRTDALKALKADLIERGDDGNAIIGNVLKMTRFNKTTVGYKAACEANELDLTEFTKESIGNYKITPIKK